MGTRRPALQVSEGKKEKGDSCAHEGISYTRIVSNSCIANVFLKLLKCLADLLGAMASVPLEIFHCRHHTDLLQLAPQAYANHP